LGKQSLNCCGALSTNLVFSNEINHIGMVDAISG